MHENSDFAMKINEINVELSGNSQRYVNECCESESDGIIDVFGAGCCKRRGGVAIAMWCGCLTPRFLNFVFKCRFHHNLTVGCVYELIKSNEIKAEPTMPTNRRPSTKRR
jgi:hypothetical protein